MLDEARQNAVAIGCRPVTCHAGVSPSDTTHRTDAGSAKNHVPAIPNHRSAKTEHTSHLMLPWLHLQPKETSMRHRCEVAVGLVPRTILKAALVLLVAGSGFGCTTESNRPTLARRALYGVLEDHTPVSVARREIPRYRCASGAVMRCNGPAGLVTQCVCSSTSTEPWPSP